MNADLFSYDAAPARFPQPREFQDRVHQELRRGFSAGHKKQVLVAATGSGKTFCALRIAHEAIQKNKRVTFVCDRTALINQTSATADRYGLVRHAVIQANHPRRDNSMPLQIASVQTLGARGYWPECDVVIIDECHTMHSAWVDYVNRTSAAVIGLTATPFTKGLGNIFTNVVNAASMDELTRLGVLVPLEIHDCMSPDMIGAATSGGEWTLKAASERELKIVGDVVPEWIKLGNHEKTIAFGPGITYCEQLVQRFTEAGIGAALYTSETPDGERAELLAEFSRPNPSIRVLVSVEALAKGFDVPDIGCVIDARPLRKSFSTFIQMIGRGLRSSPDTGKTRCRLLSFSGNIRRFYDDFVELYYNGCGELSTAEKLDAAPRKDEEEFEPLGCPQCKRKPFRRRCVACGFEKPTQTLVDSSSGVMKEIRIGKVEVAKSKQDMWAQLCTYARQTSQKPVGRAWHLYQDIVGEKPRGLTRFEDTPDVAIHPATLRKIKSMRIAWIKGRKKSASP